MSLLDWRIKLGDILIYPIILLLVAGCETQRPVSQPSPVIPTTIGSPDQLATGDQKPRDPNYYLARLKSGRNELPIEKLRYNALKEASLGFGSQTGYRERVKILTGKLAGQSNNLSVIFDFGRVATILETRNGYLLPPVVTRVYNALATDPVGKTLTSSEEYLTISKSGRLYPVLPTWRDYLLIPVSSINSPPASLIPKDPEEGKLFNFYFAKGWRLGETQANDEFQLRIRNLQQTYLGMLNYLTMVDYGIINKIVVVNEDMGNLKDNQSLHINNKIVQIVSQSSFEANPARWKVPTGAILQQDLPKATDTPL